MANLLEFSGVVFTNGRAVPFTVEIRMPEQDSSSGDYLCRVDSERLFSRPMHVYGVSWNQATRLAITLVKEVLINNVATEETQRAIHIMLWVNEQPVPTDQLHQYAIRFCQAGDEAVPVLYFQGKRVTQAWRIELIAELPEDELGKNANTT